MNVLQMSLLIKQTQCKAVFVRHTILRKYRLSFRVPGYWVALQECVMIPVPIFVHHRTYTDPVTRTSAWRNMFPHFLLLLTQSGQCEQTQALKRYRTTNNLGPPITRFCCYIILNFKLWDDKWLVNITIFSRLARDKEAEKKLGLPSMDQATAFSFLEWTRCTGNWFAQFPDVRAVTINTDRKRCPFLSDIFLHAYMTWVWLHGYAGSFP